MPHSFIRIGNISRAFDYGCSEMYNRIAQICVLFQDLRIEILRLHFLTENIDFDNVSAHSFEAFYYIRRSIATLMEYRGALDQLCLDKEFEERLPFLSDKHVCDIKRAREFLIQKHDLIKGLRNDIGGHFRFEYARHAMANLPREDAGKIEWVSESETPIWLNIDLAANIVIAGLDRTLKQEADFMTEFRHALESIGEAYQHVQAATYAVVYCFLWNRLT
jgi:hypothetical protein